MWEMGGYRCTVDGWLVWEKGGIRRMAKFGDVLLTCKMGWWVGSFGEKWEWVNTQHTLISKKY